MTIPILPIPNTQPQFSSQGPGIGGVVSDQLQQLLQALALGTQSRQRQQQLEQSGEYTRGLLENERIREAHEMQRFQAGQATERAVGEGLGELALPESDVTSIAAILRRTKPEARAKLLEQGRSLIETREKKAEVKRQDIARGEYLKLLPPPLRAIAEARWQAKAGGMGDKEVDELVNQQYINKIPPVTFDRFLRDFPQASGLPHDMQVRGIMADLEARIAAKHKVRDLDPSLKFGEIARLRGEFQNSPQFKRYDVAKTAMEQMDNLMLEDSGPADVNIMITMAKISDPETGVKQDEIRIQQIAQSLVERFGGKLSNWGRGRMLTDTQREKIVQVARQRLKPLEGNYRRNFDYYTQLTKGWGGAPFEVVGVPIEPYKAPPPGGAKSRYPENPY